MSADPRFVTAPSLQMVFRDKTTGLPLRAGVVKFYKDQARTVPKSVYKLSGAPPNYSFTDIGNEIKLTGIGTFADSSGNNDIIPYYFPYDGTPDKSEGTVELYFIQVYSSGSAVLQFSREGWPSGVANEETNEDNLVNFIPNGQFLLHTNLPETTDYDAGEIRAPITDIAQGGWTFERPVGSTARDVVTFERFGSYTESPTTSPRYAVRVKCEDPGSGGDFKDLRIKWSDVNKFASADQKYTFYLSGITNAGSSLEVGLWLIRNFGTGGSSEEERELATFTLNTSYATIRKAAFIFGTNLEKTIGALNDDFVQLAIRIPTDEISDSSLTDFGLAIGDRNITLFPISPDADFKYKSLAGQIPVPDYNAANLYLPVMLGPQGFEYDSSVIAKVRTSSSDDIDAKIELKADGAQYETAGYSASGVPYSRLHAKYWNAITGIPKWGTGRNYVMTWRGATGALVLHPNTAGSVTATADGSAATGFTFKTVATGNAAYYALASWSLGGTSFVLQNLERGAVTATTVNTSTFTISQLRKGSALLQEITAITAVAASALANPGSTAKYFRFYSYHSAAAVPFYVWYKITNETDPAIGGATGIQINLEAGDTAANVAQKTANVLNGWQVSLITATAASAIAAGSYFIFNSINTGYYVWFRKDGSGTDPAPSGRTGIEINLAASDTADIVADKMRYDINHKYFAVPDFQGMYLQGLDPNQIIDKDYRWSLVDGVGGMNVGTFQYDDNLSHLHGGGSEIGTSLPPVVDTGGGVSDAYTTRYAGSFSNHPRNAVVNFYIRY